MINSTILNYKIESLIGEGGMGSVYLASHTKLGRKAAIKVLLPELARNQQIKDRFINEAKTLSKLNHQNIVTLYDFSDDGGNLLLVMEYVEGSTLDMVIEKITGPIPEPRCINIFEKILSGFAYAHKKGIVHRDIKPSNIILHSDDTPKILDFGIAKIVEGDVRLTKTGTRMGSVVYMSPEQVLGKDVDYRSDIYSLGITFYEMLSGKLPYDTTTESEFEIQTKIVREPLKSIRTINPNVSEHIENIINTATAKEMQGRFQNCDEFREMILSESAVLSGGHLKKTTIQAPTVSTKPVNISKTTITYPINQERKKKKQIATIVAGSITVLILLTIFLYLILSNNSTQTPPISNKSMNITQSEIKNLLDNWVVYQNSKRLNDYLAMYSTNDFQGIKRTKSGKETTMNYSDWAIDRTKMYETAENLNISIYDINYKDINSNDGTALVEFSQKYESLKYSDEGSKILKFKKSNNGNIYIVYEEMKYSIGQ